MDPEPEPKRRQLTSEIINDIIPLGGTGAPLLANILKHLSVVDAYAICGPFNHEIFEFCERHQLWKTYALDTLGERKVAEYEFTFIPIRGNLNYLWMVAIDEALKQADVQIEQIGEGTIYFGAYDNRSMGTIRLRLPTQKPDTYRFHYFSNTINARQHHAFVKAIVAMDKYCEFNSVRVNATWVNGNIKYPWKLKVAAIIYHILAVPGVYLQLQPGPTRIKDELSI